MCVWVYDGSFEGLMTVVYAWFYTKEKPEKITDEAHYQPDLLLEEIRVINDQVQSQKVTDAILSKLGKEIFELLIKAYLSEDEKIALIVIDFLEYAFKNGAKVVEHLSEPRVSAFRGRAAAVSRESHKLIGLIRFEEMDNGILYAAYESTYSQLLILAPHFSQRLGNQIWVIHDTKREQAAFFRSGEWHIAPLRGDISYNKSLVEDHFQQLWKRYYKHIAIEERKNDKLRQQNMPKKYWSFLTELK